VSPNLAEPELDLLTANAGPFWSSSRRRGVRALLTACTRGPCGQSSSPEAVNVALPDASGKIRLRREAVTRLHLVDPLAIAA
jgi:hypothetical protein